MTLGTLADIVSDLILTHGEDAKVLVMDPLTGYEGWTDIFMPVVGVPPQGDKVILLFPHPELAECVNEDGDRKTVSDLEEISMT